MQSQSKEGSEVTKTAQPLQQEQKLQSFCFPSPPPHHLLTNTMLQSGRTWKGHGLCRAAQSEDPKPKSLKKMKPLVSIATTKANGSNHSNNKHQTKPDSCLD